MILWIAFAALAAAVCLPLLLALRRAPGKGAERAAVEIYRDQLAELGRDVERGLVAPAEAEAARAEIARRLIRANAAAGDASAEGDGRVRNVAAIAIVAMPLAAIALYLVLGSPGVPDQPLAARLAAPPAEQDVAALVARVEEQLKARPDDGRGWEVLAPVYMSLGRAADAATAYQNAIRLLGSTAEREGNLGEALVAANAGRVTADARAAFERARALAPTDPRSRFYLAVALGQDGKTADAIAAWQALLADAPPNADWAQMGRAELARLQGLPPTPPAAAPTAGTPAPRGPSDDEIAAAQNLPPDVRTAMIEGMVASLATRLQTESGDAEGWAQLVRSYVVLGRPDDARAALVKAKAALVADRAKTAIVDEAARTAGLTP
jgi:cytochrome c-type biogenesis protein CcmH